MSAPLQTVTALIGSCRHESGGLSAQVDPVWSQGRSVYGGAQGVLAVEAMRPLAEELPLRTLQATLCAPVAPGPVELRARLLRAGGNTRQIEARIVDGEQTLALFVGIFGRSRESQVVHDFSRPDPGPAPGTPFRFVPGITPEFIQHFDATLLAGHFPGAGQPDLRHVYRVSLKDPAATTGLPHLLAFSDFPPPLGLSWLKGFKPGSTMTWMLNFTGHPYGDQPLSDWIIDVSLDAAHDGYTLQTVTLFAPDGFAVLRGTQCMVIFG